MYVEMLKYCVNDGVCCMCTADKCVKDLINDKEFRLDFAKELNVLLNEKERLEQELADMINNYECMRKRAEEAEDKLKNVMTKIATIGGESDGWTYGGG